MSDNSEMAPITPIRNSPKFTPSPPSASALPIPSTSHQASFFAIGSPSPINHNSPSFLAFSPRHVPSVSPQSGGHPPQQEPSQSGGHAGQQNLGIPGHTEDDISSLLSNLRVDNSTQSSLIQAQAALIALLTAQARQDKKSISLLQEETKNIKDVFHDELLKTQSVHQQSIAHLCGLLEGSNSALGGRVGRLEGLNTQSMSERPKIFIEPPHQPHIFFTGSPRETNNFCFTMRNTFNRIGEQFNSEKQKIMWISLYFCSGSGHMDGEVPAYTWFRGLLLSNAEALHLPPLRASAGMNYVLAELRDVDSFINAIEHTFANHHEYEEAEAAFYAARQGNKTIKEFNILFKSLLWPLELDKRSKCKAYDKAIDPNLVKLALIRGPWTDVIDLDAKQEIAVSVLRNVAGVSKILDPKSSQPRPSHPPQQRPPVHQPPAKLPDGDAMEVDEMSAAIRESGFTYPEFRQGCVDHNLCIRCGGAFDDAHYQA
ncbi:hypothetical protein PTTG_28285 [Puccinia triticina 1-1 BBBD Race 1]|uniref:Retrotransposon gag domain-containing protein n=1 Tax=Puccinia triticina (isolate 1-1 / race 1 (BBBD)) TaxID=630390 RepID=A0A180GE05_PUCT1|nr:hypothetical protein PTTG_28285 [Puccinia triticina 1-1 BBBD Race 1]